MGAGGNAWNIRKALQNEMEMNLTIKDITKKYRKKTVLNHVSQQFGKGVYGLLGPNGAGKTTLLNIIATVTAATAGEIVFDGKNVYEMTEDYRKIIGFLPQKIDFYNHFTGYDMMKYMYHLKGGNCRNTEQIDAVLKRVNLFEVKDNRIGTYSGGMKQRLGIAQAFLGKPKILLLDEPTVGLDLEERAEFKNMIREVGKDTILLLSTHIVSDIDETADFVLIMNDGNILESREMTYYRDTLAEKGLDSLEQYYLYLTGRKLHEADGLV